MFNYICVCINYLKRELDNNYFSSTLITLFQRRQVNGYDMMARVDKPHPLYLLLCSNYFNNGQQGDFNYCV